MCKLLVIDDEAGIRFSIQQIFRSPQYVVLAAENGRDGLKQVDGESVDVVLLDIRLGGESGLELMAEIRQRNACCSIVLITGYGTDETAEEALRRGAFDYLVKPLDVNQLKQAVERGVAKSRELRALAPPDSPAG